MKNTKTKMVLLSSFVSFFGLSVYIQAASAASPTKKIQLTLANGSTSSIAVYFDAKVSKNVYIAAGSTELMVHGGGVFSKDDEGKIIGIVGAGLDGRTLTTTIKTFVNGNKVILTAPARSTAPRLMTGKGKMVAGSATLTLPDQNDNLYFTHADGGKLIWVTGAGKSGYSLATSIKSTDKPDSITLNNPAVTSVNNVTVTYGTDAVWGNDDNGAINAAVGVLIRNRGGTMQFPAGISYISNRIRYKVTKEQGISNLTIKGASANSAASMLYFGELVPWDNVNKKWATFEDPLIAFEADVGADSKNSAGLFVDGLTLKDFSLSYMLQSNQGGENEKEFYKTAPKPLILGVFSAIYINYAKNVLIQNIDMYSVFGRGISVRAANGVTIENSNLINVGGGDPASKDTMGDGILIYSSIGVNVSTNSVKNYRQYVKHNSQSQYCTGSNGSIDASGKFRCKGYSYDAGVDYYGTLSGGIGLRAEYPPGYTPSNGSVHMPPGVTSAEYTIVKFYNNTVHGYTMGVKSENGVSMEATANKVYGCYMGVLHTDIGSPKIKIINNQIDDKGVGSSPQNGFSTYAAGIALTRYGNDFENGDNLISGNSIVGKNNGIIADKSNTYIWGNTIAVEGYAFRTYGKFKNIVLRNNLIRGTAGLTYGGQVILAMDHNTVEGDGGTQVTTDGSGGEIVFTNNIFKNAQLKLANVTKASVASNTFSGADQCYINNYNSKVTYSGNKYSYTKTVSCKADL